MFPLTSPDLATALQPIIGNSPLNKPIIIVEEQPSDSHLVSVTFCFKSSLYQLFGVFLASSFFFLRFIYLLHTLFCFTCMPAGQKRAPDPITGGCEPPCGCWELNSGPLEEQPVLLTSEPSLQPWSTLVLFFWVFLGFFFFEKKKKQKHKQDRP